MHQNVKTILVALAALFIPFVSAFSQQWQRDTISEGYIYHSFKGYDSISNAHQFVNVVEIDMNNPRYRLCFDYNDPIISTSASADKCHAIAAINATYEQESVFIRTDGVTVSAIPNEWVKDTPVRQWRNDGAIYCDAKGRKVCIDYAGRGLNLNQTRRVYAARAKKWPNIFSSAPMLIDDYDPVGETFAEHGFSEKEISRIHYEDPIRHQHARHPRTAVALSADNHLYLIIVDGRWKGFSEGMSACEFTKFIRKHFNPRYALNLDGGGSTTMVVKGHGDPDTGVVNYPTDNKIFDHKGQRATCTHICVLDMKNESGIVSQRTVSAAPLQAAIPQTVAPQSAAISQAATSKDATSQTATPKKISPVIEVFHSPNLHCDDTVAVYMPTAFYKKPSETLSTLFLLHGYSGCWRDWGKNMDLQALCDKTGWRIITPDGFYASWYFNDADPSKMQWRTFFWEECYPAFKEKYSLDPHRTFIAGLSMGGHGAMNIFLDHPECFGGAGSMSGVLDLRYSGGSKERIPVIVGRKNIEQCNDFSAIYRLERLYNYGPTAVHGKTIVITCGTEDNTFLGASHMFEARCHQYGQQCIAMYSPGKHHWPYWTYILPYYIGWFNEGIERNGR